jgi:predicted transcriptional regulator
MEPTVAASIIEMTTEIVANYVTGNKMSAGDLAGLIKSVHQTLSTVDAPQVEAAPSIEMPTTAQIRKSIKPEGLISFEDGKTYQTLKRHLSTRGMSLHDYKTKWGLPSEYPTTAPNYSARRSEMAKSLGLGQPGRIRKAAEPAPAKPAPAKKSRAKAKPE